MSQSHPNAIVPFEESLGWAFGSDLEGSTAVVNPAEAMGSYFPVVYHVGQDVEVRYLGESAWLTGSVARVDDLVPTENVVVRVTVPSDLRHSPSGKSNKKSPSELSQSHSDALYEEVEFSTCFVRPARLNGSDHKIVCNPIKPAEDGKPFFDAGAYLRGDYVEVRMLYFEAEAADNVQYEWKRGRVSSVKCNNGFAGYDVRMENGTDMKGVRACHLRHHFRPKDVVDCRVPPAQSAVQAEGGVSAVEADASAPSPVDAAQQDTHKHRHHHHHHKHHNHHHHKHSKHHHHHKGHHHHHHRHHSGTEQEGGDEDAELGVPFSELPPARPWEWKPAVVLKQEKTGTYIVSFADGCKEQGVQARRLMPSNRAAVRAAAEEARVLAQTWPPVYPVLSPDPASPSPEPHPDEMERLASVQLPELVSEPSFAGAFPTISPTSSSRREPQQSPAQRQPSQPIEATPAPFSETSGPEQHLASASKPSVRFSAEASAPTPHSSFAVPSPTRPLVSLFDINDKVEVLRGHLDGEDIWLAGRVEAVHPDNAHYFVRYVDSSTDTTVPVRQMRKLSISAPPDQAVRVLSPHALSARSSSHKDAQQQRISASTTTPLSQPNSSRAVDTVTRETATAVLPGPPASDVYPARASVPTPDLIERERGPSAQSTPVAAISAPADPPAVAQQPSREFRSPEPRAQQAPAHAPAEPPVSVQVGAWLNVFNASLGAYEPCMVEAVHGDGTFDACNARGELYSMIDRSYVQSSSEVPSLAGPVHMLQHSAVKTPAPIQPIQAWPEKAIEAVPHASARTAALVQKSPSPRSPAPRNAPTPSAPAAASLPSSRGKKVSPRQPQGQAAGKGFKIGARCEALLAPGEWEAAVVVKRLAHEIYTVYLEELGEEATVVATSLRPRGRAVNHSFEEHRPQKPAVAQVAQHSPAPPAGNWALVAAGTGGVVEGTEPGMWTDDLAAESLDGSLEDDSLVVLSKDAALSSPSLVPVEVSPAPLLSPEILHGAAHTPLRATRPTTAPGSNLSVRSAALRSQGGGPAHRAVAVVPQGVLFGTEKPVSLKARMHEQSAAIARTPQLSGAAPTVIAGRAELTCTVVYQARCTPGTATPLLVLLSGSWECVKPGTAFNVVIASEFATFGQGSGGEVQHTFWPEEGAGNEVHCGVMARCTLSPVSPAHCPVRVSVFVGPVLVAEATMALSPVHKMGTGGSWAPAGSVVHSGGDRRGKQRLVPGSRNGSLWVRTTVTVKSHLWVILCPSVEEAIMERCVAEAVGALKGVTTVKCFLASHLDTSTTDEILAGDGTVQFAVSLREGGLRRQTWLSLLKGAPLCDRIARHCAQRVRISTHGTYSTGAEPASRSWLPSCGLTALDLVPASLLTADEVSVRMWLSEPEHTVRRMRYLRAHMVLSAAIQWVVGGSVPGLLLIPAGGTTLRTAQWTAEALSDGLHGLVGRDKAGRGAEPAQHNEEPAVVALSSWKLCILTEYSTEEDLVTLPAESLREEEVRTFLPLLKASAALALCRSLGQAHLFPSPPGPLCTRWAAERFTSDQLRALLSAYQRWEWECQHHYFTGVRVPLPDAAQLTAVRDPIEIAASALEEAQISLACCSGRSETGASSQIRDAITYVLGERLEKAGAPELYRLRLGGKSLFWATLAGGDSSLREVLTRGGAAEAGEVPEIVGASIELNLDEVPELQQALTDRTEPGLHPEDNGSRLSPEKVALHGELVAVVVEEVGVRDRFSAQEAAACLVEMGCSSVADLVAVGSLFQREGGGLDAEGLRAFFREGGIPLFIAAKLTGFVQKKHVAEAAGSNGVAPIK